MQAGKTGWRPTDWTENAKKIAYTVNFQADWDSKLYMFCLYKPGTRATKIDVK